MITVDTYPCWGCGSGRGKLRGPWQSRRLTWCDDCLADEKVRRFVTGSIRFVTTELVRGDECMRCGWAVAPWHRQVVVTAPNGDRRVMHAVNEDCDLAKWTNGPQWMSDRAKEARKD